MTKSEHTVGVCPSCNWKGESPFDLHALDKEGKATIPVCPKCTTILKIVTIRSVTVPFSKTDKPATEEATW